MDDVDLLPGDIIHSINNVSVTGLDDLRRELRAIKAGDAVVLQIERNGRMDYLPFAVE